MKKVKPINATWKQLIRIYRDNCDSGDYWCIVDSVHVTFCQQKVGHAARAEITIPIKHARHLIAFLTRGYKLKDTP